MSLHKYPKVKYPKSVETITDGEPVVVQEKIDGANGRFGVTDSGEIVFGSRNVVFQDDEGEPTKVCNVNQAFVHAVAYLKATVDIDRFQEFEEEYGRLTVYGECLHTHAIEYDSWSGRHPTIESETPNFLVFDMYSEDDGWLSPTEMRNITQAIGLTSVPQVGVFESFDFESFEIPQSEYRTPNPNADDEFTRQGLAEGVVIKHQETGERAKLVHESFREVKGGQTGEVEQYDFVSKYITRPRVEKLAHKLIDSGEYDSLQMDMMSDLHEEVFEDAVEEADETDITWSNDEEGDVRSQSASETATHLQQILQNK